jgi:hypothetical protein
VSLKPGANSPFFRLKPEATSGGGASTSAAAVVQLAHVMRARFHFGQPQRRMLRRRREQLARGRIRTLPYRIGVVPQREQ